MQVKWARYLSKRHDYMRYEEIIMRVAASLSRSLPQFLNQHQERPRRIPWDCSSYDFSGVRK